MAVLSQEANVRKLLFDLALESIRRGAPGLTPATQEGIARSFALKATERWKDFGRG